MTTAAVDTEGRVCGCYRSVYDPRRERVALGDIFGGPVNELPVATYARPGIALGPEK